MKTLKQILEVYKPKSADEKKFVDKHIVVKHKDRNGNGDDVFQATNVKTVGRKKERHGYDPNDDEKVYEEVEQVDEGNPTNKMKSKFYQIAQGVKKLGPEKLKQAQIDTPDKSIKGQSKAVTDAAKRAARNEEVEYVEEKLKVSDGVGKWISDFVHSDNPKFSGKSKKERTQMALGAFYSAKRGE